MSDRLLRLALAALTTLVAPAALAQAQASGSPWKPDTPTPAYPFIFGGYGDTRFTDPADTRHSNAAVRRAVISRIAQEKVAFVVISGDIVLIGADAQDWKVFDAETAPLRQADIELLPALGNHDVRGREDRALENYFRRFPRLEGRRWYSARAANVLILVPDSTDGPGSQPWQWLEQGLEALPPDVDFVLVPLHHPPLHSHDKMLGGGHSERPQEEQLASLLEKRHGREVGGAGFFHVDGRRSKAGGI